MVRFLLFKCLWETSEHSLNQNIARYKVPEITSNGGQRQLGGVQSRKMLENAGTKVRHIHDAYRLYSSKGVVIYNLMYKGNWIQFCLVVNKVKKNYRKPIVIRIYVPQGARALL